nr:MAG TPA: hypothetical protein [Microviridae sp.]
MSDIKCPFCQQKLEINDLDVQILGCENQNCKHSTLYDIVGTKELWQELIRTRKALKIAVDALKEQQRWIGVIRVSLISHLNNEYGTLFKSYDADPTVVNTKRARDMLNTALDEITALEQKGE